MKKIGDIMQEMGFRNEAPESLKESFLNYLIKQAAETRAPLPVEVTLKANEKNPLKSETKTRKKKAKEADPRQLSFDFSTEDDPKKIKVS